MLTKDKQQEIADKIKDSGVKFICPMCGNNNFGVGEGYISNFIQDDFNNISIGGQSIRTIPIICSKCGFVSQHSAILLKLV